MACRDRPNLKNLDLQAQNGFGLSPTQIEQVAAFLGENPSVEKLTFETGASMAPLGLALATNTNLTALTSNCMLLKDDDAAASFLVAMETNYTFCDILVFAKEFKPLRVSKQTSAKGDLIWFYRKLNREFSRKHLLAPDSNASKNDWINALALANQRKEDFDVVFYYLSQNIGLIMEAHVEAESRRNAFFGMPAGSAGKKRDRQT